MKSDHRLFSIAFPAEEIYRTRKPKLITDDLNEVMADINAMHSRIDEWNQKIKQLKTFKDNKKLMQEIRKLYDAKKQANREISQLRNRISNFGRSVTPWDSLFINQCFEELNKRLNKVRKIIDDYKLNLSKFFPEHDSSEMPVSEQMIDREKDSVSSCVML